MEVSQHEPKVLGNDRGARMPFWYAHADCQDPAVSSVLNGRRSSLRHVMIIDIFAGSIGVNGGSVIPPQGLRQDVVTIDGAT
jgi:hypothetical protein